MAEEVKNEEVKADAEDKLDGITQVMDAIKAMGARFDSMSSRLDAIEEARKDSKRKDEEEEAKVDGDEDEDELKVDAEEEEFGEAAEPVRDSKRKDARKDEDEEAKADEDGEEVMDAIADAVARKLGLTDVKAGISRVEKIISGRSLTDAEHNRLAELQAKADPIFGAFGDRAPRPLDGERPTGYRRRLINALKQHSPTWASVNLDAIQDTTALDAIEGQVFADAAAAARSPIDIGPGQLREVRRTDNTGTRVITEFHGDPMAWMSDFIGNPQRGGLQINRPN